MDRLAIPKCPGFYKSEPEAVMKLLPIEEVKSGPIATSYCAKIRAMISLYLSLVSHAPAAK